MDRLQCLEIWGGIRSVDTGVAVPNFNAWVTSHPHEASEQGGGDVHYLTLCSKGLLTRLLLADVAGHGADVSELAKSLHQLMRDHVDLLDQRQIAQQLNHTFSQTQSIRGSFRFATAVILTYYEGQLYVVNAGHPPPLWYRASRKQWQWLTPENETEAASSSSLPLGVLDESQFTQFELSLEIGDIIIAYSDALIEARQNGDGPQLSPASLLELAQSIEVNDQPVSAGTELVSKIEAFRGHTPADDDLTCITLHHHGQGTMPI